MMASVKVCPVRNERCNSEDGREKPNEANADHKPLPIDSSINSPMMDHDGAGSDRKQPIGGKTQRHHAENPMYHSGFSGLGLAAATFFNRSAQRASGRQYGCTRA